MKTKQPASSKKPAITLKDLTTRKNPKGGANNLKLASSAGAKESAAMQPKDWRQ